MRLIEVIQRSTAFLEERGVESPRLQVEWILAHQLRVPRLQLYLQFERELADPALGGIREAVRRRGRREPLQHILGSAAFCGLDFEVGREALIPRPETELLAERAWTWLRERFPAGTAGAAATAETAETAGTAGTAGVPTVLDWGTGTGCLAVTLAVRIPEARVAGLDVSTAALDLARRNGARHGVAERIRWVEGDGCGALDPGDAFDLVVSNPPYIPAAELAGLAPEVREHDPRLALDGGVDGLDFYRRLAEELGPRIRSGGRAMLEFGDGQAPEVSALFRGAGWIVDDVQRDYSGRDRFLVVRRAD